MDSSFDLSWGSLDGLGRCFLNLFSIHEREVLMLEVRRISCGVPSPRPECCSLSQSRFRVRLRFRLFDVTPHRNVVVIREPTVSRYALSERACYARNRHGSSAERGPFCPHASGQWELEFWQPHCVWVCLAGSSANNCPRPYVWPDDPNKHINSKYDIDGVPDAR